MNLNTLILLFAVLLRIISNPIANVFQKQLTIKGFSPLFINFFTYFILSLLCALASFQLQWTHLSTSFWIYSIIVGVLGGLGNSFLVRALQAGDLSVLGPINSYKSIISMFIGFFLLNETPTIWGILGVGLIITGSYFVLNTTDEGFSWQLLKRKEIQYRIWAMMLTAAEAIFVKKVVLASSTTHAFFTWCWFGTFFSLILLLWSDKKDLQNNIKHIHLKHISSFFFLVLSIGVMIITTNYAFQQMPVGYALSLFQLSVIVNIFLGYKIFKEQEVYKKLIGALIMIVGSVIIILF